MDKIYYCRVCDTRLTEENWYSNHFKCKSCICKNCDKARLKKDNIKLKLEIINAYGGKCVCCSCSFVPFLTIDHINGGGCKQRKQLSKMGDKFYRWLKDNNFPKDNFQLLCLNCNSAKHIYGACPHNIKNDKVPSLKEIIRKQPAKQIDNDQKYCRGCNNLLNNDNWSISSRKNMFYICKECKNERQNTLRYYLRKEVLGAYGNECACCSCNIIEFLSIDHINNDGGNHRKEIGERNLYRWLRNNNFPKDNFQILCFNCNIAKRICNGICSCQISNE